MHIPIHIILYETSEEEEDEDCEASTFQYVSALNVWGTKEHGSFIGTLRIPNTEHQQGTMFHVYKIP